MSLPPVTGRRLPDGRIEAPIRAEADGVIGDGVTVLSPGDAGYDRWDRYLTSIEQADGPVCGYRLLHGPEEDD